MKPSQKKNVRKNKLGCLYILHELVVAGLFALYPTPKSVMMNNCKICPLNNLMLIFLET